MVEKSNWSSLIIVVCTTQFDVLLLFVSSQTGSLSDWIHHGRHYVHMPGLYIYRIRRKLLSEKQLFLFSWIGHQSRLDGVLPHCWFGIFQLERLPRRIYIGQTGGTKEKSRREIPARIHGLQIRMRGRLRTSQDTATIHAAGRRKLQR